MREFRFVVWVLLLAACSNDEPTSVLDDETYQPTPVELNIPTFFKSSIIDPVIPISNPLTEEGIVLGKKLFFDPVLSVDHSISCADCHMPNSAFTDTNVLSEGVNGALGSRNAMPLFNLAWNFDELFFWDGSASSLENQVFHPVTDSSEMANTWEKVVSDLESDSEYPDLFFAAFAEEGIDSLKVAKAIAQFERTLIIADEDSYVSYLEGCTAPMRDENQLHAAVVELVAMDDAQIKYSTVQNWYPGDEEGKGGIYNFVTKRGVAHTNSKISWTQVETGSAVTWKYPSCVLKGDNSVGEFYSVALTRGRQQADTGTKMIHIGKNTRSTIISKGISAGRSNNAYRGLVQMGPKADGARNFTECDSLLIGDQCGAHTFPYIESRNPSAIVEHEATTSKVSDDQLFLCQQRGMDAEKAVSMIVNGFCKEVFKELPMEFAVEAGKLLEISLEGSVG